MRSVVAAISAILFFGIGWLLVGFILALMGWGIAKTGYAPNLVLVIHVFLIWILSPGVGAAIAILAASSIFGSVSLSTIYTSFVSICATASFLLFVVGLRSDQSSRTLVVFVLQVGAVFLGAYVGRFFSTLNNASLGQTVTRKSTETPPTLSNVRDGPSVAPIPEPHPGITQIAPYPRDEISPEPSPRNGPTTVPPKQPLIQTTDEFRATIDYVSKRRGNLLVTGLAGTGKSTLLREIREICERNVAILAPTGLAAINVNGQTIHSFFRFKPGLLGAEAIRISRKAALYRSLDTIIIDEISMVRADLMEAIDHFLRINRGRQHEPFGGVRVILVGDTHQLPPVVNDPEIQRYLSDRFGGIYFFNANIFQDEPPKYCELTKKFRQSDDPLFARILDRIAEGNLLDDDLDILNRKVTSLDKLDRNNVTILAPRNQTVSDLNMQFLNLLRGPEQELVAIVAGDFDESSFPTDQTLRLKVGAKVVLLRNDIGKRWVNGTIATIAKLKEGRIWISLRGIEHELERHAWQKFRYDYDPEKKKIVEREVGSFRQFPVRLAWALTIHKSQGMTLENVYLDLAGGAFAHGQTYVALSRCRRLDGLKLARPLQASDIIFDPAAIGYRHLCERIAAPPASR